MCPLTHSSRCKILDGDWNLIPYGPYGNASAIELIHIIYEDKTSTRNPGARIHLHPTIDKLNFSETPDLTPPRPFVAPRVNETTILETLDIYASL